MNFRLTKGEIAILIAMVLAIITINALIRVRAMGAAQKLMDDEHARADAGFDAGTGN